MEIDYLIIGQGLAGSLLAFELLKRDCKVLVIDNGKENASQVAAGLINPVTGMRFVKSLDVEELLPVAKTYYQQLSQRFKQSFYIEKPMFRLLRSQKELDNVHKRLQQQDYQTYLGDFVANTRLNAPFGVIEQRQTGYLLTQALLAQLKQFFIQQNGYIKAEVDYADINLSKNVTWQQWQAKKIIFCEGWQAINNPYFSNLPFQLAKGEILSLETQQLISDKLLNYGHWMIPLTQHQLRTGASFEREQLDTIPTAKAKQDLLHSLQQIVPYPFSLTLTKHQANIRPCTLDKRPFIGIHPKYEQLAIFNGFGAKGSLQIPYYAKQFADYLLLQKKLDFNVDIQRFADRLVVN